jgi:hypothetical protein
MPTDPNETRDNALRAIELLTAWVQSDRSNAFLTERVAAIGNEEGREGFAKSFVGLMQVSGYMLVLISRLVGQLSEEQVLQTIASYFLGQSSPSQLIKEMTDAIDGFIARKISERDGAALHNAGFTAIADALGL